MEIVVDSTSLTLDCGLSPTPGRSARSGITPFYHPAYLFTLPLADQGWVGFFVEGAALHTSRTLVKLIWSMPYPKREQVPPSVYLTGMPACK